MTDRVRVDEYLRHVLYARDEGKCQVCLKHVDFEDMVCAHLLAACFGGQATEDNLRTVHLRCNGMPYFKSKEIGQRWFEAKQEVAKIEKENKLMSVPTKVLQLSGTKLIAEAVADLASAPVETDVVDVSKISRTKIARAVKVDLAYISRIFSGKQSPSPDLARRIANYMNIPQDKLLVLLGELQHNTKIAAEAIVASDPMPHTDAEPSNEQEPTGTCRRCGKVSELRAYGFMWSGGKQIQKYQCLDCGYVSRYF